MAKSSTGASAVSAYVDPVDRKSGWDDYDLKNMLKTLTDAEKIKRNKPLMAALRRQADQQLATLQRTKTSLSQGK